MIAVDYVVVGSGLTGAVIARLLADAGRDVLVVDRRAHFGGNVHDHAHASGIRIHTYGPHYFRTSSDRIWDFATRFAAFYRYEACLVSLVDGQYENWPVAASYIRKRLGADWTPEFVGTPHDFEQAALALMPRLIYEKFVKEYNEKQRFDVRADDEPRLKPNCKHQGIPECGYAEWMRRMLEGIPVVLNFDYLQRREGVSARKLLVFTGPIDEFFGFDNGKLAYRGQRREHVYMEDTDWAQPCGQVNCPAHADGPHVRDLEWKHMMPASYARRIRGTVLTREYPFSPSDPGQYEYPFPDRVNAELYQAYRARANGLKNVLLCGRLGEYRYFDMDQAIGRALTLVESILPKQTMVRPMGAPGYAATAACTT
jgi:UDP-galactopyranose mutase